MKTKHTQGEWKVSNLCGNDKKIYHITAGGKSYTNEVCALYAAPNNGDIEANAKLISAAPDLLEACMEIRKTLGALIDFKGLLEQDKKRFELIQKAIKKATE